MGRAHHLPDFCRAEPRALRILDNVAAKEGLSIPAFISRLHSEVLELHGEASNFISLLRCACTIHLGEYEIEEDARLAAE